MSWYPMVFKKMYKCKLTVNENFCEHLIINLSKQSKENIGFIIMYFFSCAFFIVWSRSFALRMDFGRIFDILGTLERGGQNQGIPGIAVIIQKTNIGQ